MNVWLLLTELKRLLEPALQTLPLPVRWREAQGEGAQDAPDARTARVFLGSMPPTAQDAVSAAPFIVLQALNGFDADGLHVARVALRLCIVSEDLEEAENDLHNLISLARLRLLSLPDKALQGRFRLIGENQGELAPWERPDEQVYPFLQAHILTAWQMKGAVGVSRIL